MGQVVRHQPGAGQNHPEPGYYRAAGGGKVPAWEAFGLLQPLVIERHGTGGGSDRGGAGQRHENPRDRRL